MSLEDALNRHSDLLEQLLKRLNAGVLSKVDPPAPKKKPPSEAPVPSLEQEFPTYPSYETVKTAILQLSETKGPTAAFALLGRFGVKSGKELKPNQYQDLLTAIQNEHTPLA